MWKWRDDPRDDLVLKLYALLAVVLVGTAAYGTIGDNRNQHDELKAKCAAQRGDDKGAVLYLRDGTPMCLNWDASERSPIW
jgi:hypothetical protein